jgi:hypothetical protein
MLAPDERFFLRKDDVAIFATAKGDLLAITRDHLFPVSQFSAQVPN